MYNHYLHFCIVIDTCTAGKFFPTASLLHHVHYVLHAMCCMMMRAAPADMPPPTEVYLYRKFHPQVHAQQLYSISEIMLLKSTITILLTLKVLGTTIDALGHFKQDYHSRVGGVGGCRVSEVRAGTTSPMPDHKGFKLQ